MAAPCRRCGEPRERIFLSENNAWIFISDHTVGTNAAGRLTIKGWHGRGDFPVLYAFEKDLGNVLAIPIELDLNKAVIDPPVLDKILYDYANEGTPILQTFPTTEGIAAIVPRFQFPAPGSNKPSTVREWFDLTYQVIHADTKEPTEEKK